MGNLPRAAAISLAALLLVAAAPSMSNKVPEWVLGDWTPVDVWQNAEMRYQPAPDDPKHWYADQHLSITPTSLTLADDRCINPAVSFHHGPPNFPIHKFGGATLQDLGLPASNKPVDYFAFDCAHDLTRTGKTGKYENDRTIPITWYAIVSSHTEIYLPFFAGSYIKFRKTSPTS